MTNPAPTTIQLRDTLERMFPEELRRRKLPPSSTLMNRGRSESLEHVVSIALRTDFKGEDLEPFAVGGYLENITLPTGDKYQGMTVDDYRKVLSSELDLTERSTPFVAVQDVKFKRRVGGFSFYDAGAAITKTLATLGTLYATWKYNQSYHEPVVASVAEAVGESIAAYVVTGTGFRWLEKVLMERSRKSKNKKLLANGYTDLTKGYINDHLENLRKLKAAIDVAIPDTEAEKLQKYAAPFNEQEFIDGYKGTLTPEERKNLLRDARIEHRKTQRQLRTALHAYWKLEEQLPAMEQLQRYITDPTSTYQPLAKRK